MQKKVEDAINLLTKAFNKHFDDFHGLYLHGAFVDGKNHRDEDIELVAIFEKEDRYKREVIWPIVGQIETHLDVFIDLNPTTMADLKKDEELWDEINKRGMFFDPMGQMQVK